MVGQQARPVREPDPMTAGPQCTAARINFPFSSQAVVSFLKKP
jgi:hypothetical protein